MVLGPKHVVSFGPKYDWLPEIGPNLVVFLGPKRDVKRNGEVNGNNGNAKTRSYKSPLGPIWRGPRRVEAVIAKFEPSGKDAPEKVDAPSRLHSNADWALSRVCSRLRLE